MAYLFPAKAIIALLPVAAGFVWAGTLVAKSPVQYWKSPWRIDGGYNFAHHSLKARLIGTAYVYLGTNRAKEISIVNLQPHKLGALLSDWNRETYNIPPAAGTQLGSGGYSPWLFNQAMAHGWWHVASTVEGMNLPVEAVTPGTTAPRPLKNLHRKYLQLTFSMPNDEEEIWQINGPLQGELYAPLRNLLSTCALANDPSNPPPILRFNIPVIVGKDAKGKDIIRMEPLISRIVKKGG